jgi:hypothetical protein
MCNHCWTVWEYMSIPLNQFDAMTWYERFCVCCNEIERKDFVELKVIRDVLYEA